MDAPMAKPRRHRLLLWSIVGVVVVGAVVGGLLVAKNARGNGKKKSDKDAPPAAAVELTEVRRGSIATYLQTTTTLEARNSAVLVASRQGQVRRSWPRKDSGWQRAPRWRGSTTPRRGSRSSARRWRRRSPSAKRSGAAS